MKTKMAIIAALLTFAGLAVYTNTTLFAQAANTPETGQPDENVLIRRAAHALGQAQADLKLAQHDFGGHRAAALKACDQAIAECKLAMEYNKK